MALRGFVAIVTGGANGLGRSIVLLLAGEGAFVVVGDLDDDQGLLVQQQWEKNDNFVEIEETDRRKGSVTFHHFDARQSTSCQELVEFTVQKHGHLDILVNNVGIQPTQSAVPLHLLSDLLWDDILTVNLKCAFWMCKYSIPHLLTQNTSTHDNKLRIRSSIVNIASIQGVQSQKGVGAYAASKGGLLSLTRQLACEYGGQGLRVNAVSPGSVPTELMRQNTNLEYVTSNTPLKRLGEPEDVARAVLFLVDPNSSGWLTAQNIVLDGGITSKGGWATLDV